MSLRLGMPDSYLCTTKTPRFARTDAQPLTRKPKPRKDLGSRQSSCIKLPGNSNPYSSR